MDEHHLATWQISEFTPGHLDKDDLEEVYRHVDV